MDGCISSFCLLCLLQVQQGEWKQRVIDEMLHIVLLTLLLGLGAHLIGYILLGVESEKEAEFSLYIMVKVWFVFSIF